MFKKHYSFQVYKQAKPSHTDKHEERNRNLERDQETKTAVSDKERNNKKVGRMIRKDREKKKGERQRCQLQIPFISQKHISCKRTQVEIAVSTEEGFKYLYFIYLFKIHSVLVVVALQSTLGPATLGPTGWLFPKAGAKDYPSHTHPVPHIVDLRK